MRGPKKRLTPFGKMVVKALADRDMSRAELAARVRAFTHYVGPVRSAEDRGVEKEPATMGSPRRAP